MSNPPAEDATQSRKLPVCKVNATFSGVEDFPLFWERYALNRDINVSNGYWATAAEQAQQFARLLTGDAFKHYVSLPTATKEDIKLLYAAFKSKYDAPSSEYTYRQQVHDLQRISNEPLSEFAYRVENLVNKAYPNSQEKQSRILDAFVAGVDKKLAEKYYEVEGKKPDGSAMSLRELIAFFERFERIWKIPHDSQVCSAQASSNTPSQFDELGQQICALQAQVASLNTRANCGRKKGYSGQQNSRNGRPRSQRQKECYYCHSTSHFWSDCSARHQENPSWTPPWMNNRNQSRREGRSLPNNYQGNSPGQSHQWQYHQSRFVRGAPADYSPDLNM